MGPRWDSCTRNVSDVWSRWSLGIFCIFRGALRYDIEPLMASRFPDDEPTVFKDQHWMKPRSGAHPRDDVGFVTPLKNSAHIKIRVRMPFTRMDHA